MNVYLGSSKRELTIFVLRLIIISLGISYLYVKIGIIILLTVIVLMLLCVILIYDYKLRLSNYANSILIPLVIWIVPFEGIFLTTYPTQVGAQFLVFLLILFYVGSYSSQSRMHYFKKIQPLIFPTTIFTLSIILAYIIAGRFLNEDWAFLLNTLGAIGFAYLACIYCNRLNDINKILWILIVIGALQLPLMFAQSHGWTDKLPANFSMLSSTFGQQDLGPLHNLMAHVTALRYGGIFGSPELMAEFLDIVALFCIGICLFGTSKKERLVAILALCLILAAGFYTGTRAFIWSLGVGLFVMLFLMTIKPGFSRNLAQLLAVGCFLGLILIFLSTQEIFRGYIYRFLQTDFSSNYYDSRNIVWSVSLSLLNKLPFTGYGGWMMEIFDTKGGAVFVGPHSIYLFMLLKAGYPGLIAIIAFISIPIYWMLRIFFRGINKTAQSWAIVLLSVWIFWAVNEIKIEFVRYPFYMDIIFLLFGIMASFYNMNIKHLKDVNVLIP